jgi:hypothetical protein
MLLAYCERGSRVIGSGLLKETGGSGSILAKGGCPGAYALVVVVVAECVHSVDAFVLLCDLPRQRLCSIV